MVKILLMRQSLQSDPDKPFWIDITDPSPQELEDLAKEYGLHPVNFFLAADFYCGSVRDEFCVHARDQIALGLSYCFDFNVFG